MTKSRRERQLDQTRWVEWAYYALTLGVAMVSVRLYSMQVTLNLLLGLVLLGVPLWLWQYSVLDELGRLRFIKSWAISGILTSSVLSLVALWYTYQFAPLQVVQSSAQAPAQLSVSIPLEVILLVLLMSLLSASIAHVLLRRRDERA